MIGKTIGNFRIVEQIGSGGMGAVYLAEHETIGNQVAIKMLRPELGYREELVKRFFNEARAITRVKHPSIVSIHDFGVSGERDMYIVMEYLRGETLGERLRQQRALPWQQAVSLARQVASALDVAHKQKIVHRDLKPDNLFLVEDPAVTSGERVKLLDFGVAKFLEAEGNSAHTMTGQILGTPAYMAPEQCASEMDLDGRVDLYALGCILFQMVCGRPPFGQANTSGGAGVLVAQIHDAPPKPREFAPKLPKKLEALILRLLEKKREKRYADARALINALDELLGTRGEPSVVTSPTSTGAHALGTPSTLDAAASASYNGGSFPGVSRRTGSRTPWAFGLGMLIAVAAVVGFLYQGQLKGMLGMAPDDQTDDQTVGQAVGATAEPGPGEMGGDTEGDAPGARTGPEASAPDAVEVTIDSRPTGAQIFAGDSDEALGVTPHKVTVTRGGDDALTFLISAHGYEDHTVEVSGSDPADVTAELVKLQGRLSAAERKARAEQGSTGAAGQKQSGQTPPDPQRSDQKKSGQKKSGQKKSGQKKSGQKKSGKKKSGKKKSGKKKSGKKKPGSTERSLNPFD